MIQLSQIDKIYTQKDVQTVALNNINLQISRSEFIAIMGRSGSGKTTLLHILGAMDHYSKGSYLFNGVEIEKMDRKELAHFRNREIGFVFQSFHLIPELTALQNVEVPLGYAGIGRKQRHSIAENMLAKVNLSDRIHHDPSELSGGQQQRVAIARALANKPSIVLADEPTGNLDSNNGQEIMELFKLLNQEGMTIVVITHDPFIARYANRVIELQDGHIISDTHSISDN